MSQPTQGSFGSRARVAVTVAYSRSPSDTDRARHGWRTPTLYLPKLRVGYFRPWAIAGVFRDDERRAKHLVGDASCAYTHFGEVCGLGRGASCSVGRAERIIRSVPLVKLKTACLFKRHFQ
jgi:hypothetical protein